MIRLLRHPEPQFEPGLCYGQTDLTLAPGWEKEIERIATALPRPERLVTSPLGRCAGPAQRLAEIWGLSVDQDARLKEMDFGHWEGRLWESLPRAELDAWAADFYDARPHGGESVGDLQARVRSWLADHHDVEVLALTHLGVIRAAAAHFDTPDPWQLKINFAQHWTAP